MRYIPKMRSGSLCEVQRCFCVLFVLMEGWGLLYGEGWEDIRVL